MLAVVLVAVLTVNVGNLRVGGSVGCLMSGIYVLAVVLTVVLGIRGGGGGGRIKNNL